MSILFNMLLVMANALLFVFLVNLLADVYANHTREKKLKGNLSQES